MDGVYDTMKRQYNIPNALISIIKEYAYDWKGLFKQCINNMECGKHITSDFIRSSNIIPYYSYINDIYQLQCKNHLFRVLLSNPYISNIKATNISKSIPIFHCKICRKYHNKYGVKKCSTFDIKLT